MCVYSEYIVSKGTACRKALACKRLMESRHMAETWAWDLVLPLSASQSFRVYRRHPCSTALTSTHSITTAQQLRVFLSKPTTLTKSSRTQTWTRLFFSRNTSYFSYLILSQYSQVLSRKANIKTKPNLKWVCLFVETGSHAVALTGFKFIKWPRQALSTGSAGIKGMSHSTWQT